MAHSIISINGYIIPSSTQKKGNYGVEQLTSFLISIGAIVTKSDKGYAELVLDGKTIKVVSY